MIIGLRDSRLPIVAAVHGPAYGAGFSTALACDLIVASEDARFCQVFVRRNLVPDLGSPWLLPRAVGQHVAKELMLLGEEISAAEAHRLGIVNRLAATPAEAHELALSLAAKMATTLPGDDGDEQGADQPQPGADAGGLAAVRGARPGDGARHRRDTRRDARLSREGRSIDDGTRRRT